MNDLERAEKEVISKPAKFMVFIQVVMTVCLVVAILVTLSPYISVVVFAVKFIVMAIITIATGFLILLSENFRKLWGKVIDHKDVTANFVNLGYIFYGIALGLAIITLLYFIFNKKLTNKKGHYIFSAIVIVLVIAGMIANHFVIKSIPPVSELV